MITGDHKDTAVSIGKELGIINSEKEALTGSDLEKMLKLIIDEVAILSNMDKKEKALAAK